MRKNFYITIIFILVLIVVRLICELYGIGEYFYLFAIGCLTGTCYVVVREIAGE